MARILYIRNPSQPDDCLSGAMAAYIRRIPPRFDLFTDAVTYLSRAKFEADDGKSGDDHRCFPAQRARIWPATFNCWEATAHLAAEGARLLPSDWIIRVHDQNYGAYRHVWATLEFPGLLGPFRPAANLSAEDVLGGFHVVGKTALSVFGLGAVADRVEDLEGDALPDWAKPASKRKKPAEPEAASGETESQSKKAEPEKKRTEPATASKPGGSQSPPGNGITDPI